MILYRCRHLVSMDRPPLEDGGLVVSGGKVLATGRFDDLLPGHAGQVVDLGDVIVLPGLINAHCHLEYTQMRNLNLTQRSFAKWIQRINAAKRNLSDDDYLDGIRQGAAELLRHGTTSVLNIESYPELLVRLPELPLRVWWFYELIDIRLRQHSRESMHGAMMVFDEPTQDRVRHGLSPHAPYTASKRLYQLSRDAARVAGLPLTTHIAESSEEMTMFRDGSGPLFDFLCQLGWRADGVGGRTPFQYAVENEMIAPDALLVHLNELDDSDLELIPRFTAGGALQVAHCPKSHRFFGHRAFCYEELVGLGANISLGTDSLASNDSLDLFAEMRAFAQIHPRVSAERILEMVTINPAKSLHLENSLGRLIPGAFADAIAIPAPKNPRDIFEAILHYDRTVTWMLINGQEIIF